MIIERVAFRHYVLWKSETICVRWQLWLHFAL